MERCCLAGLAIVLRVGEISGLPLPSFTNASFRDFLMKSVYLLVVGIFGVYVAALTIVSILIVDSFENFCILCCMLMLQSTTVFLTLFYFVFRQDFKTLTDRMDSLSRLILSSGLGDTHVFLGISNRYSYMLCKYIRIVSVTVWMCPVSYCILQTVLDYFNGDYGVRSVVPVYYAVDMRRPGVFELFVGVQVLSLALPALMKLANDCIMLGLYFTECAYIQYLSHVMNTLAEDFYTTQPLLVHNKLITWIKIHKEVLRHVQDVIAFFAPVVIVYYVNIITMVACGLFYQMNSEQPSVLQISSLGCYLVVTVFQLYLQCAMADQIEVLSEELVRNAYSFPWYEMPEKQKHMFRLIINMGIRPVRITAYRAFTFTLNKESFLAFLVNTVSAYMAFSKVNNIK